jgi:YesN/AraC family two-component response regulator
MTAFRVLIADDERPARRFLANLIGDIADVEVVGEAANGQEAVDLIERLKPDLALLDLQMPELGGLDAARLVAARCRRSCSSPPSTSTPSRPSS